MHIEKIILNNFKAFSYLEFNCNNNFNVIIGENNIGKTTLFEALSLWKFAYDNLIQDNGRKFYQAGTSNYLSFNDVFNVRMIDDKDIFFDSSKRSLAITLFVVVETEKFELEIKLEKPGIKNSYFRIFINEKIYEFNRFASFIEDKECTLINAIFIYQTRPISTITKNEPFYNNAQIDKKISLGESHDVLRNKVLKTENSTVRVKEKFQKLENRLTKVLQNEYLIRVKNKNKQDEEHVRISAQIKGGKELELSMMGSGFLQVVEIFSTLEYVEENKDGACIILIDEPDSHIHSDLQSSLIKELKVNNSSQIFLITHNDRLVKIASVGELFYLNNNVKNDGKLNALEIESFHNVTKELASILVSLDEEGNIPIVLTEGKTDQKILNTAWQKLNPRKKQPFKVISSGLEFEEEKRTGNAETVRRVVEYISTISDRQIIGLFDNDREGREQYKGLNNKIFEPYDQQFDSRKHLQKNIYGLCLTVPAFRENFITRNSITQRYFVMEHYFENDVLQQNSLIGDHILDTEVFEISGNKSLFADKCADLAKRKFKHFEQLFDKISELI